MRSGAKLALRLVLLGLLAVSSPGCVMKAVVDDVAPRAMTWATEDRLEVQFQPPDAWGSVRLVRHGDTADVGTARAYLRAPGHPAHDTMLAEAREGPLSSSDTVVACYDLEPPLRLGQGGASEATALMLVEHEGAASMLVRGPLGWARANTWDFQRSEPSAAKAVVAAGGVTVLLVFGLTADAVIGAAIAAGFLGLCWLYAGCPGLAQAICH